MALLTATTTLAVALTRSQRAPGPASHPPVTITSEVSMRRSLSHAFQRYDSAVGPPLTISGGPFVLIRVALRQVGHRQVERVIGTEVLDWDKSHPRTVGLDLIRVHTEEVRGSIPRSPTALLQARGHPDDDLGGLSASSATVRRCRVAVGEAVRFY